VDIPKGAKIRPAVTDGLSAGSYNIGVLCVGGPPGRTGCILGRMLTGFVGILAVACAGVPKAVPRTPDERWADSDRRCSADVDACVKRCDAEVHARADEQARRFDLALANLGDLTAPPMKGDLPETPSCETLVVYYVTGNASLTDWQRTHAPRYSDAGIHGQAKELEREVRAACKRGEKYACLVDEKLGLWLWTHPSPPPAGMLADGDFPRRRGCLTEPTPQCPDGTWWDGFACAHAPATCGGWDGSSCARASTSAPEAVETAAERELAAIDDDARRICPEDDGNLRPYRGTLATATDEARVALTLAAGVDARLERLSSSARSPQWTALGAARAGSIYDCIWTTLRRAMMTHATHLDETTGASARSAPNYGTADWAVRLMDPTWREVLDRYAGQAAGKMLTDYVTVDLLARRFAFGGGQIAQARERLPKVAAAIGEARVHELLKGFVDPTAPAPDPKQRGGVRSVPGLRLKQDDCRVREEYMPDSR